MKFHNYISTLEIRPSLCIRCYHYTLFRDFISHILQFQNQAVSFEFISQALIKSSTEIYKKGTAFCYSFLWTRNPKPMSRAEVLIKEVGRVKLWKKTLSL